MARDAAAWYGVLRDSKIGRATAEFWAPIFAEIVKDDTFSAGEEDLQDFLPQIFHESQGLTKMVENLNYSAGRIRQLAAASQPGSRWREIGPRADELAGKPMAMAEAIYGGRMGNRPEGSGDGWAYIGRTPLGITGLDNYMYVGNLMGQDLDVNPQLLEQPRYALEACIAWWEGRIPDSMLGNQVALRKRVNGGTFGLGETKHLADIVRAALEKNP